MTKNIKQTEEIPASVEYNKADDVIFVLTESGVWSSLPESAVPQSIEEFAELPPHHHYGLLIETLIKDHEALDICAVLYSWVVDNEVTQEDLMKAKEALALLGFFTDRPAPKNQATVKREVAFCGWLQVDE